MIKEVITNLHEYNVWATARVLGCADQMPQEQRHAKMDPSQRSLHEMLVHMVDVERVWRHIVSTGAMNEPRLRAVEIQGIGAVRMLWEQETDLMRKYLATVTEEQLNEGIQVTNPRGGTNTFMRGHLILHSLMHSMQHRIEAAMLMTAFGQAPGDLDFIFFLMGR